MVENNDNVQKRDKDNKKSCRRRNEEKQGRSYTFGRGLNGRIRERGARNGEEERVDGKRKSKDKVENAEGKRMMEWIEENGWEVLNGNKQGDEEEARTYSRGETVTDYGIVNDEAWERVEEFRIGEKAGSHHLEIASRKRRGGKEQRRKGVGGRNKTVYFCFFLEWLGKPVGQNKAFYLFGTS
jgi:hypothetical protein